MSPKPEAKPEACVRADVWLWRARFFKTRTLAARALAEGAVRLSRGPATRALDKPGATLKPGDGLSLVRAGKVVTILVVAAGTRRGPPEEARLLYRDPCRDA